MDSRAHTVVVGGGCLGVAAAISIRRRLNQQGNNEKVILVEKAILGSGLSSRHSGIVRAANAEPAAAQLAMIASKMWLDLKNSWGVDLKNEQFGAVWIARADAAGDNPKWRSLQEKLHNTGVPFNRISLDEARDICPPNVILNQNEVFYHEPDALQIDPSHFRAAAYDAVSFNDVEIREKTDVVGFIRNESGQIDSVITDNGIIPSRYVVNALGPWSPRLFASLGLQVPVSAESVTVVNWLTSRNHEQFKMPIIADYVNLAYFRLWRDGEIHMHQPRKRGPKETARAFAESPLSVMGADFVNDPTNQALGYSQIKQFEDIARRRFNDVDKTVYGSGYRSYFDITPDLKFILGPDHRLTNLIHCLGAGQSFKYAPVFGEIMADFVTGGQAFAPIAQEFSIERFDQSYMSTFWAQVAGSENSLAVGDTNL